MDSSIKNTINNILNSESISSLKKYEGFYFQKAKDALNHFLQLKVNDETKTFLLENRKNYDNLKQLFEDDEEFSVFGRAILSVISYCDSKALKKNILNQYDDKRVLALAFVRMNNWIEQLITYKFEDRLETGSIKNAVEYLINPEDNFTMLSENHRNQLCENLFKKKYDKDTFKDDFISFFNEFSIKVKNSSNLTHLLTRICYEINSQWKEIIIGLMSPDSTGWQKGSIGDFSNADAITLWHHKKPNGTNNTIKLLRQCIADNGFFNIFYSENNHIKYVAEIVDFVINQDELDQVEWHNHYFNIAWFNDKLEKYDDGSRTASIVYLANDFYEIEPIHKELFKYFGKFGYPSVGCQGPVISSEVNIEKKINTQMKEYKKLLDYKKQIILQGPPGTGKTKSAKEIAQILISSNIKLKQNIETEDVIVVNKHFVKNILATGQQIKGRNDLYEVVSIDDKGVFLKTYKTREAGWKASFKMIIDSYNKKLFENESRTGRGSYEDAVALLINEKFKNKEAKIRYKYEDFQKIIQFHPSYTYEDFVRGVVAKPNEKGEGIVYDAENKTLAKFAEDATNDADNNYVLIIDEINRANLSSVLGELIYALEYRGEEVESMYEVDGSQKLILPPNLYIIGTMNTADRSVGHIDYAIRRRFAFVEVLPKELKDDKIIFHQDWFRKVSELFIENYDEYVANDKVALKRAKTLSGEFRPEDVWIGHSYFIQKKLENGSLEPDDFRIRVDYEIKPILLEYVKDGVLTGKVGALTIEDYIKSL